MEMFGDSDDEDQTLSTCGSSACGTQGRVDLSKICNVLFVHLMRLKPTLRHTAIDRVAAYLHTADELQSSFARETVDELVGSAHHHPFVHPAEIVLHRHIALVNGTETGATAHSATLDLLHSIQHRLRSAKFQFVDILQCGASAPSDNCYDALAYLDDGLIESFEPLLSPLLSSVVPGGCVVLCCKREKIEETTVRELVFPACTWVVEVMPTEFADSFIEDWVTVCARKRAVDCNTEAAQYWSTSPHAVEHERNLLEKVTVPLAVSERLSGTFSDFSHKRAVKALNHYGVCIFRGVFDTCEVLQWGQHACQDMQMVVDKLLERGADMLEPREGQWIENYHEMSMREAFRCDVRNGFALKAANAAAVERFGIGAGAVGAVVTPSVKPTAAPAATATAPTTTTTTSTPAATSKGGVSSVEDPTTAAAHRKKNLKYNPSIMDVLIEVMNPGSQDARGNWGRYNFDGGGPEIGPPPVKAGELGCIFSVPGCIDQTIHTDTPHLYVHTHLPGHYFNLFIPAIEKDSLRSQHSVGQTAFIATSHILKECTRMMVLEGGQDLLEANLLRPHLQAGDALLFDCRILHMGLANTGATPGRSSGQSAWRPMLYVNYHQHWFHDPKNWNNAEKLFT